MLGLGALVERFLTTEGAEYTEEDGREDGVMIHEVFE
jgi:hypothetical protein